MRERIPGAMEWRKALVFVSFSFQGYALIQHYDIGYPLSNLMFVVLFGDLI
jgi:hypothetical protein